VASVARAEGDEVEGRQTGQASPTGKEAKVVASRIFRKVPAPDEAESGAAGLAQAPPASRGCKVKASNMFKKGVGGSQAEEAPMPQGQSPSFPSADELLAQLDAEEKLGELGSLD